MTDYNLLNTVLALSFQMAAELDTSKTEFTLDTIEEMRTLFHKDYWEQLTALEKSDDTGRVIANSVVDQLFKLAFNNIRSVRIINQTTLEVVLINKISIHNLTSHCVYLRIPHNV